MGDDSKGGGHIGLVSSQSEAEVVRGREMPRISYKLRAMMANLLRVTRGAGKPEQILRDCKEFLDSVEELYDKSETYPNGKELKQMLSIKKEYSFKISDDEKEREHAEIVIVRGALQISASRLLGQLTQERAGDSEMYEGIRVMEDIRERNRAAHRKR